MRAARVSAQVGSTWKFASRRLLCANAFDRRGANFVIAMKSDVAVPLIIGDYHDDVGVTFGSRRTDAGGAIENGNDLAKRCDLVAAARFV